MTVGHNTGGHDEAFAIRPDGYVYSYRTCAETGNARRLVSSGLEAVQFVLVTPAHDCCVLVTANSSSGLSTAMESGGPGPKWQKSQPVLFSGLQNAIQICEPHAIDVNEHALVGVLAIHQIQAGLDNYHFWVAKWTGEQLQWRSTLVALDGSDPLGKHFMLNCKSSGHTLQ